MGSMVSSRGMTPVPSDVAALQLMPAPTSRSELRSFLGMVNHYRLYIHKYAELVAPLSRLTSESVPFVWSSAEDALFTTLKSIIASDLIVALPRLQENFFLVTDASLKGVAGVVFQVQPDGREAPVAFLSRATTDAEKHYPVVDLELLAIVFVVAKVRHWIFGKRTVVITDH